MQQLLTGQTRLPGFSGEWEVKRLGRFRRSETELINANMLRVAFHFLVLRV